MFLSFNFLSHVPRRNQRTSKVRWGLNNKVIYNFFVINDSFFVTLIFYNVLFTSFVQLNVTIN